MLLTNPPGLPGLPPASRVAMVHVADPRVRWSVAASRVMRIVPAADWHAPVVDVLASLGPPPLPGAQAYRVAILRGAGDRELAVLAAGTIDIAEVDAVQVLALPDAFATTPQVSAIIVAADHSLSLLLQPSAVLPPDDTVLGEELCPSRS